MLGTTSILKHHRTKPERRGASDSIICHIIFPFGKCWGQGGSRDGMQHLLWDVGNKGGHVACTGTSVYNMLWCGLTQISCSLAWIIIVLPLRRVWRQPKPNHLQSNLNILCIGQTRGPRICKTLDMQTCRLSLKLRGENMQIYELNLSLAPCNFCCSCVDSEAARTWTSLMKTDLVAVHKLPPTRCTPSLSPSGFAASNQQCHAFMKQ